MGRPALVMGTGIGLLLATPGAEAGTLYVTNQGSGNVAILDEATLTVRKLIPVGEKPWGVAATPDGKAACVARAAGLAFGDVDAGTAARQVNLGGDGRRVFLTGGFALGGHDELTVVDLSTGAVTLVGAGATRPFAILRLP